MPAGPECTPEKQPESRPQTTQEILRLYLDVSEMRGSTPPVAKMRIFDLARNSMDDGYRLSEDDKKKLKAIGINPDELFDFSSDFDQKFEEMPPHKRIGFLESHYVKASKSRDHEAVAQAADLLERWNGKYPQDLDFTPHMERLDVRYATGIDDEMASELIDGIRSQVRETLLGELDRIEAFNAPLLHLLDR